MISKRISAIIILFTLSFMAVSCFVRAYFMDISFPISGEGKASFAQMEDFLREAVPFSRTLKSMRVNLQYYLGKREQDGIFIAEHKLIENIKTPNSKYVQKNTDAIVEFAERQMIPTYVMLIPTASAILQSETPQFADANIYNQKLFIEDRYKLFAGKLSCVDVYYILRQNSNEYIYYNTEPMLTPQGGYLVYSILAKRMGNISYDYNRFKIQYLKNDYFGSLYDRVEFKNINPDVISTYTYSNSEKEFTVIHYGEVLREYNTLYPTHLLDLNREMDVCLGGLSPKIDIIQKKKNNKSLLVFGDEQMLSILPFLACDYYKITFVDLEQIHPQGLSDLVFSDYTEILFAYSVDTFIHTNAISRVALY